MRAMKHAPVTLVHHELALDAYLQALLASVPDEEEEPLVAAAAAEPVVETLVAVKPPPVVAESAIILPEPVVNPVPAPFQQEFHALFFRIGEITLATPVSDVRRIVEYCATTTALPNQPSWLLGLVENQGEKIGVMHTAELVLGRENIQRRDFGARPYRQIIITRQGRFGFACDEVLEMVKLKPEDVRWRHPQLGGRAAWLMGTVSERLCALVDLNELTPIRR